MFKKFLERNQDYFFFVFRVVVGLMFLLHGWMKVPGIMDGTFGLGSLMFYAGIIEVIGGLFIIVGLFTRTVSTIAAVEMVFAYFMAHAGSGLSPLANKGEPAVLLFASFLILMSHGARKWSVDNLMHNRD
jgi:putative oxidoreductase